MTARVFHAGLHGSREDDYGVLAQTAVSSNGRTELQPEGPHAFVVSRFRVVRD